MSKRHLIDKAALDGGFDVVATGHNLDDEAAVLLGNVLHWHTEYLGRQAPVLPARDGFPRKVKPLVRLGERETAAYCVLRGIDYIVDECPMAEGNRHLRYKEALNAIEAASPGTKHAFYFEFLDKAADRFRPEAAEAQEGCGPAGAGRRPPARCAPSAGWSSARPTPSRCPSSCCARAAAAAGPRAGRRTPGATREPALRRRRPGAAHRRQEAPLPGDARPPGASSTPTPGVIAHDDLIGAAEGAVVPVQPGAAMLAIRPTLADFVLKMPRGAQVIYPKDLGPILMLADIFPGARVLESGVGSGALSMTLVRAGAVVTGYELREDFANRAQRNVATFLGDDALERYTVEHPRRLRRHRRDRPRPGRARPARAVAGGQARRPGHAPGRRARGLHAADHAGGAARDELAAQGFGMVDTIEVLNRGWHIEGQSVGPTTAWSPTPASSRARGC